MDIVLHPLGKKIDCFCLVVAAVVAVVVVLLLSLLLDVFTSTVLFQSLLPPPIAPSSTSGERITPATMASPTDRAQHTIFSFVPQAHTRSRTVFLDNPPLQHPPPLYKFVAT